MTKLEAVASKIGVGAEYMFGVYVKQANVEIVEFTISFIIATVFVSFCMFTLAKALKNDGFTDENFPTFYSLSFIITAFINIFLLINVLVEFGNVITCIFNPEFYALDKLFKSIK